MWKQLGATIGAAELREPKILKKGGKTDGRAVMTGKNLPTRFESPTTRKLRDWGGRF